jgi:hypothetical protein
MRSCKNQVLIRCFLFFTSCVEFYHNTSRRISNFVSYLIDYYHGHHDTWLFIHGHSNPISLNNFYNINGVSWIFDNETTTLEKTSIPEKSHYKLSWLSANIVIHSEKEEQDDQEFDMDSFLHSFTMKTIPAESPTLSILFQAWCASTKHWFDPQSHVEFHIIDQMGDDIVLKIGEDTESLSSFLIRYHS